MTTRASARAKGKFLERVVGRVLAYVTGLAEEDFHHSVRGIRSPDIRLSKEARKRWPLHTECKNHKQLNVTAWWRQAVRDASSVGLPPCLVFKLHGQREPLVLLSLTDFLNLLYGPLSSEQVDRILYLLDKRSPLS